MVMKFKMIIKKKILKYVKYTVNLKLMQKLEFYMNLTKYG